MALAPEESGIAGLVGGKRKTPIATPIEWQAPFDAYRKVYAPNSFLLESVCGPPRVARYSIIGLEPHTIFQSQGRDIRITDEGGERLVVGDPFDILRGLCRGYKVDPGHRFAGGAVGFFGYDAGRQIEALPNLAVDDLALPESVFFFCSVFLVFDHENETAEAIVMVDDAGPGPSRLEARRRLDDIAVKLNRPVEPVRGGVGGRLTQWSSNFTKERFVEVVKEAKSYIGAGDIYQVNLSQRLVAQVVAPPLAVYSILREINPSPFSGFFDFGSWHLVGCSPERLVRLEGRDVQTRPIAGTIRRGRSEVEDSRLKDQLTMDIKERAEHIMLVDLERNDLGRVCEFGSVKVDELTVTESYSHVTHIVSNVVGLLRPDRDGFDLIRASFPGGTITGCPKIRAMEIIEELEPVRRGPYTGSMGYIGFNGDLDFNIIIRTLVIKDGLAYVQAGAGIVADSDPEREYHETLYKAEALVQATTLAEERHGCLPT